MYVTCSSVNLLPSQAYQSLTDFDLWMRLTFSRVVHTVQFLSEIIENVSKTFIMAEDTLVSHDH